MRPVDRRVDAFACATGQGCAVASSQGQIERHPDAKVDAQTKPGGKSVKQPGRNSGAGDTDDGHGPRRAVYHRPFLAQWPDQDAATKMLDIVSDSILDLDTLRFRAVVLPTFVEPYDAGSCRDVVA